MPKNINLDPVLRLVAGRLIEDRQRLSRLLESGSTGDFRDFDEQERLLESIQAAVRALDILEGRAKPDEEDRPTGVANASAAVDMDKLAAALRPNGAGH